MFIIKVEFERFVKSDDPKIVLSINKAKALPMSYSHAIATLHRLTRMHYLASVIPLGAV